MDFPPFEHAAWLAEAWKDGPPEHDLGASGFRSPIVDGLLPHGREPHDVEGMDLHASIRLRDDVARMHAVPQEQVRITAGTSAANLAAIATLVKPGSNVVCERPTYMPLAALAQGFGAHIRWVDHDEDGLDVDAMAKMCDKDTAALLVTSPNNPTGKPLSRPDLDWLGDAAETHGAMVVADQVYQQLTDHAFGGHPGIVATAGVNKCWGAPGLRVGWAIGPEKFMAKLEETHRLLSLAPSSWGTRMASELLGHYQACKEELAEHVRIANTIFQAWLVEEELHATSGGLVALLDVDADARALLEAGVLTVPGALFGARGLRLGFGGDLAALPAALDALGAGIRAQRF